MWVAKQDLAIGIDGSGSVREDGFKVWVAYSQTLLKRDQTEYFEQEAMRIGVLLFGNGKIIYDNFNGWCQ